jgi:NAD-dependent histone deacetylase SIR2
LYNEAHKDGEGVGDVVRKDLMGRTSAADLLLVVGTSLRVPGTKRMVREFAKAVRARAGASSPKEDPSNPGTSSPPRRSPTTDEDPLPKAVYLNLDFPVPTREWEGVFDAWVQGDAQEFAAVLSAEIEKEANAKHLASERKRKRDEAAAAAIDKDDEMPDLQSGTRKFGIENKDSPTKQRPPPVSPTPSSTKKKKKRVTRRGPSSDEDDNDSGRFHASSPKLTVRIPPPHSRPSPYYVPEVYITSKAPQYLRRYGMMPGNMPGVGRQQSSTTVASALGGEMDAMDVDRDVRVQADLGGDGSLSSSSSSPAPSDSSLSETPTSSPPSSTSSPPGFARRSRSNTSLRLSAASISLPSPPTRVGCDEDKVEVGMKMRNRNGKGWG